MKIISWRGLSWHLKMYSDTAHMTDFVAVMLFSGRQISARGLYNPYQSDVYFDKHLGSETLHP